MEKIYRVQMNSKGMPNFSTAEEVADRPQGEWIETSEGTICGNCGASPYDDGEYRIANWHSNYCPNCGARMKGADDE